MKPSQYEIYATALADKVLPCAFLDLNRLQENITAVLKRAGNKPIRIATKSIRCVEIIQLIQKQSSCFRGLMTYSPWETAFLCEQGFDDFLLGYPVYQRSSIEVLIPWIQSGKNIVFMVDLPEHIQMLATIAQEKQVSISVCIDLDLSSDFPGVYFGVYRSSITSAHKALDLAKQIRSYANLSLVGIMGYEAQIAGVPDAEPSSGIKNIIVRYLKQASIRELVKRRGETVELLKKNGFDLRIVNGGGTGSLESTKQEESVTEITVGSAFFNPAVFDHYADYRHQPAAGFALEITRHPQPNIYTCSGGGYVASGAAGPTKLPRPWLPEGIQLIANEGAGEVQTPFRYSGSEPLRIGKPVFFRHAKAGELCERFLELQLI
ncbi:MAG: amino acid deaminase/aldolase, partial [Bacteroidia bacterium]|nr:amino acid deaminase/aldolase [Bacteroidia bacterium]